jgi:hypothetical protein
MLNKPSRIAIVVLAIGVTAVLFSRPATLNSPESRPQGVIRPHTHIRNAVKNFSDENIKELRFHGVDMGYFGGEDGYLKVHDKRLIGTFIDALKNAESRSFTDPKRGIKNIGIGDEVDTLELMPRGKVDLQNLPSFSFNTRIIRLGEKFKAALVTLGAFQASEVRQQTARLKPEQIANASLGGTEVTDRKRITVILYALQNVDEHAFVYSAQRTALDDFELNLKNGRNLSYRFVADKKAHSLFQTIANL